MKLSNCTFRIFSLLLLLYFMLSHSWAKVDLEGYQRAWRLRHAADDGLMLQVGDRRHMETYMETYGKT